MRVGRLFFAQHAPLGGGERIGRVAALVLEQVAQILVGRDAEQPATAREAGGQLEIGEIGVAVASAQPVLLLGEIVVADAGAMQLAQRRLGRAEDSRARRAAWRCGAATPSIQPRTSARRAANKQRRRDAELARDRERAALAPEQMARQREAPPRHLIDPAQHRLDLARRACGSGRAPRSRTRRA